MTKFWEQNWEFMFEHWFIHTNLMPHHHHLCKNDSLWKTTHVSYHAHWSQPLSKSFHVPHIRLFPSLSTISSLKCSENSWNSICFQNQNLLSDPCFLVRGKCSTSRESSTQNYLHFTLKIWSSDHVSFTFVSPGHVRKWVSYFLFVDTIFSKVKLQHLVWQHEHSYKKKTD